MGSPRLGAEVQKALAMVNASKRPDWQMAAWPCGTAKIDLVRYSFLAKVNGARSSLTSRAVFTITFSGTDLDERLRVADKQSVWPRDISKDMRARRFACEALI
jgi:hypothetical protein